MFVKLRVISKIIRDKKKYFYLIFYYLCIIIILKKIQINHIINYIIS